MKALVIRAVVVLAVVTGFTVSAEAQPVVPEGHAAGVTISATVTSVGVLDRS